MAVAAVQGLGQIQQQWQLEASQRTDVNLATQAAADK